MRVTYPSFDLFIDAVLDWTFAVTQIKTKKFPPLIFPRMNFGDNIKNYLSSDWQGVG